MSEQGKEMSFLDHLEELRWHLVRQVLRYFCYCHCAISNARLCISQSFY